MRPWRVRWASVIRPPTAGTLARVRGGAEAHRVPRRRAGALIAALLGIAVLAAPAGSTAAGSGGPARTAEGPAASASRTTHRRTAKHHARSRRAACARARRVARRAHGRRRSRSARCRTARRHRRPAAPKRLPPAPAAAPVVPTAPTAPAPPVEPPGSGAVAPSRLLVSAREYSLTLSRPHLAAGAAIVQLDNRGQDAHDLTLRPAGGSAVPLIPETQSLNIATSPKTTLAAGTYTLYCDLPGHAALGMSATVTFG